MTDKGCDAAANRQAARDRGICPVIPYRSNAKHLKALRCRTPFQAVCDAWTKDPAIFKIIPHHLIPGPNT